MLLNSLSSIDNPQHGSVITREPLYGDLRFRVTVLQGVNDEITDRTVQLDHVPKNEALMTQTEANEPVGPCRS